MRRSLLVLLLVLALCPAGVQADEKKPEEKPKKPLTDVQAADAVLVAVKAKDDAALKALAEKDRPDPWLVADLLCYRDEHDAAEAFATAAPRGDTEKLPGYVEAWSRREPDKAERELMAAMNAAIRARTPQRVIEETAPLKPTLDTVIRVRLRHARGIALGILGRPEESADVLHEAADAALVLGWLARASRLYDEAGLSAHNGSAWPRALASLEQSLALAKRRGNKPGAARTVSNIGLVHQSLGDYAKALANLEQALAETKALGDTQGAATALGNIGLVHQGLGDYAKALSTLEQALAEKKALADTQGAASTLGNIGLVHENLGHHAKALSTLEQALAEQRARGDKRSAATTFGNIGNVHYHLGDYAKALAIYERALAEKKALGDKRGAAVTFGNIGNIRQSLGDYDKALSTYEQALAEQKAMGDKHGAAATLGSIGNVHYYLGDEARALAIYQQAHAEHRALGEKQGAATTLGNIALVYQSLGDSAKALATHERALAEKQALGDKRGATHTLLNIGSVHRSLGDYARARRLFEQGARAANSLRATVLLVDAYGRLARLHLTTGRPARALGAAQKALREVEGLLGDLGQEQGAMARERHASLFATGALAAVREEDAAEALAFLESGRAGALLDTLDKREALRWKAESLSPELRGLDLEAQAKESAARHAYDLVVKRGNRKESRAARDALSDATDVVREVAGRIQRELKQQAGLFYPRAKTIEEIESTLGADQALVLYGLYLDEQDLDEALALVLRPDGERVVSLGKASEITAACEALDASNPNVDPTAALHTLRKRLVEPLKLGTDVQQVLLSPEGPLCYVPFGALFDQTVAMTPSGTTHVLLLDEEREAGTGILALGDPDYGGVSKGAQAIYYRGRGLAPLPATRKEVQTIGTQTLLGAKASEAGLKEALPAAKRWRAVHFACHGLVDIERPMLSSLALSSAGEDDGFLTALEILRTKIPADLAVLSACETGKGKIVKGEGIVGLTRAFMFAGAPRVICSLWKVDDEVTQALMIKFYELWNPKDGSKGLGVAAALKKAQEYVRDFKDKSGKQKWKHPYYWAAWVLWGLPD